MENPEQGGKRPSKGLLWTARIWGTLVLIVALFIFIGFVSEFFGAGTTDPYAEEEYPFIENIPPLLMFISALGLGLAWRWESWGGAVAVLFQLVNLPILLIHWPLAGNFLRYLIAPYGLAVVVAVPGILFLIYARQARMRTDAGGGD